MNFLLFCFGGVCTSPKQGSRNPFAIALCVCYSAAMQALTFWKTVTMDRSNLLEQVLALLAAHDVPYCVIGGQAVNAYADPVVSLGLDLVVAVDRLAEVVQLLAERFEVKHFPHSLNVYLPGSDLRVQLQTDARYAEFPQRATVRDVLGLALPVASLEDTLRGKVWAALDPERRASKRQKDLADIARLLESYPELKPLVPQQLLDRLL